ncbi:family 78 glycoside hydrolase catalytic domain [Demequina sp. SYSU T00192]|uniref:alpha-L-rhamnosidase n=1 Tax=Demequina litoralis TaxID=3051660 RepID=A0ABT8G6H6_9MICO|nr:family 78 glycoside hydrolase catalytic domain [Demequina sp. SYSU T00192]MDN4474745.1 family 78 glycoside hydrolase catalytic domain [Demequina sp. SYSU T00192]
MTQLWLDGRGGPRFLASPTPTLTWTTASDREGWLQSAAQVELSLAGEATVADLDGRGSVAVAWPFAPLAPYTRGSVRVRVRAEGEEWSAWSTAVEVLTGPLGAEDVSASFVTAAAPLVEDEATRPTVRAAGAVEVRAGLARAVLTSTALGVYEPVVNGAVATDEVLAPGWTVYQDRLLFQTVDVTDLLHEGANVVGAEVAEGWHRERFGFDGAFSVAYEGETSLLMQLRLEYADGTVETHGTGEGWLATRTGPTLSASIYQGERRDERLADDGLASLADGAPALADAAPARIVPHPAAALEPAAAPPVRRIETVAPVETTTLEDGTVRLDLGENLVGWLRIRATAPAGTEITLRHAEVIEDGALGTRPLRHAANTDTVVVGASGTVDFAPRFTFHGFRYAEVSGLPSADALDSAEAVVIHTDMVRTGWWECSDPLLTQLHRNVVWGMRGNFVSLPTDCPQRDERLGWTGDIQVFAPTAAYLYDSGAMLGSWLRDLEAEQTRFDGVVPNFVPNPVPGTPVLPAAAWGDAATLVPDALFTALGDAAVLARQYASMTAWAETVLAAADEDGLWVGGFQFGDWLDPSAPPHNPSAAKADPDIVATAYLYRTLVACERAATVLDLPEDATRWNALADRTRASFLATYVTPTGRILSDSHTVYALAIAFGLLDGDARRQAAGDRLAELVVSHGFRIRTGFVGTPLLCDALTTTGHRDVAHRLIAETGLPSWLYPVTMGATTIWERWDSMLPDGSINPGEMTSFNHYALGAVADWLHRDVAGLSPVEPGYRTARIAPRPGGSLTSASTAHDSAYGRFEVAWTLADGTLAVTATVPPNTTAVVSLPGLEDFEVGSGSYTWEVPFAGEARAPQRITMDTRISDLAWDPATAGRIMGVWGRTGYFIGFGWNDGGRWRPDTTFRNGLPMMTPPQLAVLGAELDAINVQHGLEPCGEEHWRL